MAGCFDLRTSRRDYVETAKFWSNKLNKNLNEITKLEIPTGVFKCKQENATAINLDDIGNKFRYAEQTLTIATLDNVSKLKVDDIIKFRDEFYRVENIQKVPLRNTAYYGSNLIKYETYIALRGNV